MCVCVFVYLTPLCHCCPCSSSKSYGLKSLKPSLPKVLSFAVRTQIVCKGLRCLFFRAQRPHCHRTGKSAGRWRLALRVHRVLHPEKSKVAKFVCKLKCLLLDATLNSYLHVNPLCCWMRDSPAQKRKTLSECGWGLTDFVCLFVCFSGFQLMMIIMIFQSSAAERVMTEDKYFCCKVQNMLKILFLL